MSLGTLRILLVDDEQFALDMMEKLLLRHDDIEIIGKCVDEKCAISHLIDQQPDVIFQDIEMDGTNGLDLATEYTKYDFKGKLVFVTAHAQYAIKAIKKSAFDYILKPVKTAEFDELILRLRSEKARSLDQKSYLQNKLKIPTRNGYTLIRKDDIVYCEAQGNYTRIVANFSAETISSMHLGMIESSLPVSSFFRINRSVIINLNFLHAVNKGEKKCSIKLENEIVSLHISRNRLKELEKKL